MDGWREYSGVTLHYTATCPDGWTDWMAAIELIAAAGQAIGIEITTNFPPWIPDYSSVVTNWSVLSVTPGFDIFMMWSDGAGPTTPWARIRHLLSSEYAGMDGNWNGNWGGYSNPAMDAIIAQIPTADPTVVKELYTDAVEIYLTDIPSFTVMYRPDQFHTVNGVIWTSFPNSSDGLNIPPLNLINGYSIAGLYNLRLVQRSMLPMVVK
jgi:peptide/nickel transport system substrate-binding protein